MEEVLRNHAKYVQHFVAQVKSEEITKQLEMDMLLTVKDLNITMAELETPTKTPETEELKFAMKLFIRQGLQIVKKKKANVPLLEEDKQQFFTYVQNWKSHIVTLKASLAASSAVRGSSITQPFIEKTSYSLSSPQTSLQDLQTVVEDPTDSSVLSEVLVPRKKKNTIDLSTHPPPSPTPDITSPASTPATLKSSTTSDLKATPSGTPSGSALSGSALSRSTLSGSTQTQIVSDPSPNVDKEEKPKSYRQESPPTTSNDKAPQSSREISFLEAQTGIKPKVPIQIPSLAKPNESSSKAISALIQDESLLSPKNPKAPPRQQIPEMDNSESRSNSSRPTTDKSDRHLEKTQKMEEQVTSPSPNIPKFNLEPLQTPILKPKPTILRPSNAVLPKPKPLQEVKHSYSENDLEAFLDEEALDAAFDGLAEDDIDIPTQKPDKPKEVMQTNEGSIHFSENKEIHTETDMSVQKDGKKSGVPSSWSTSMNRSSLDKLEPLKSEEKDKLSRSGKVKESKDSPKHKETEFPHSPKKKETEFAHSPKKRETNETSVAVETPNKTEVPEIDLSNKKEASSKDSREKKPKKSGKKKSSKKESSFLKNAENLPVNSKRSPKAPVTAEDVPSERPKAMWAKRSVTRGFISTTTGTKPLSPKEGPLAEQPQEDTSQRSGKNVSLGLMRKATQNKLKPEEKKEQPPSPVKWKKIKPEAVVENQQSSDNSIEKKIASLPSSELLAFLDDIDIDELEMSLLEGSDSKKTEIEQLKSKISQLQLQLEVPEEDAYLAPPTPKLSVDSPNDELRNRLTQLQAQMQSLGISPEEDLDLPDEDDAQSIREALAMLGNHQEEEEFPMSKELLEALEFGVDEEYLLPTDQPTTMSKELLESLDLDENDDEETLRKQIALIKAQIPTSEDKNLDVINTTSETMATDLKSLLGIEDLKDEDLLLLEQELELEGGGDRWTSSQERESAPKEEVISSGPLTGFLVSDLEIIGIRSIEELESLSSEEIEERLKLLEEWENNELGDELQRLAMVDTSTKLSAEELEALLQMDDEGFDIAVQDVKNYMNELIKSNDADVQLQAIEKLAEVAGTDGRTVEIMCKEGLMEKFPIFFKTKGNQFLLSICNIIASIPLKSEFRLSLANSQIISFLMENYKSPVGPLSKAAEDALIKLSQKNPHLPLILQLLTSESKQTQGKAKNKLKQTCTMFTITATSESLSAPTNTTLIEFIENVGLSRLSPSILLGLTDEQLMLFMPLIIKDSQNSKPIAKFIKNWQSLLHRLQLSPMIGNLFYWNGNIEGIFKPVPKNMGDISVFCRTKELEDTELFFHRCLVNWENIKKGYSRDNMNIVDPLTGRKIKSFLVEVPSKDMGSSLNVNLMYHNARKRDKDNGERGRIGLLKGEDVRIGIINIQTLINIFNTIWKQAKIVPRPEMKTYRSVPLTRTFGCYELLEPSLSVKSFDWLSLEQASEKVKLSIAGSLAAAVTTSIVLGFKDKLQDYLFAYKNQFYFSSINKVHIWNAKPIHSDFYTKLKYIISAAFNWTLFQNICLDIFKSLYEKGSIIQMICRTLYESTYTKEVIDNFLNTKSLMLAFPLKEAMEQFTATLNETTSLKKKIFQKVKTKKTKK